MSCLTAQSKGPIASFGGREFGFLPQAVRPDPYHRARQPGIQAQPNSNKVELNSKLLHILHIQSSCVLPARTGAPALMPPLFLVWSLLKTLPRDSSLFLQSSWSLISRLLLKSRPFLRTVVVVTRCFPLKFIKHNIRSARCPSRLDHCTVNLFTSVLESIALPLLLPRTVCILSDPESTL